MDQWSGGGNGGVGGNYQPWVRLILDTDMATDPGDAGTLRMLHTLADMGLVAILGVMCCGTYTYAPGCSDAINRFCGRPDIPIGVNKGPPLAPGPDAEVFNKYITEHFTNIYPTAASAPDAITQYLSILAGQPDQSVVVCAGGQLANLAHIYGFPAGKALYDAKVIRTNIMGGDYPTGNEYNFYTDPGSAQFFVNNNTGRMEFFGFTPGNGVLTGQAVINQSNLSDPNYWAFKLFKDANPTLVPRESWDQLNLLKSIYGNSFNSVTYFSETSGGSNTVAGNGTNSWGAPVKNQSYASLVASVSTFSSLIDSLMTRRPALA